jgi:hypothetical protein
MEKMRYKTTVTVTNIDWDVDKKSDLKNLPKEITYAFDDDDLMDVDINNNEEVEEEIGTLVENKLSNDYGYCHNGFEIEFGEIEFEEMQESPLNKIVEQYEKSFEKSYIIISEYTTDFALTSTALINHMEAVRIENLEDFEDYHLESHKHWDNKKVLTLDDVISYYKEAMQGDNYFQLHELDFESKTVNSILRNTYTDSLLSKATPLNYSFDEIKKEFKESGTNDFLRVEYLDKFDFIEDAYNFTHDKTLKEAQITESIEEPEQKSKVKKQR